MATLPRKSQGFEIRVKANEAEILLYEEIDQYFGIGAKAFREELKAAGDVSRIKVRVNSPGGNIFDGLAIYNSLKSHPAHKVVVIDGVALSMASVIAMAGDEIEIAESGFIMIHNPTNVAVGDSEDMRQMSDLLDKLKDQLVNIYALRTKQDPETIASWMDSETWMTAAESVERGFADRSMKTLAVAATFDMSRFSNTPTNLNRGDNTMPESKMESVTNTATLQTPPPVANYTEIVGACPCADSDFICSQLKANATVEQARTAWMAEQNKRLVEAQSKATDAEAKVKAAEAEALSAKSKVSVPGVAPLGASGSNASSTGGDPIAAWNALVDGYAKSTGNRGKAISMAVRNHPEAHRDYLVAFNADRGRRVNL
jgi:ATP-dependent protease ClpP protease subunit